MGLGFKDFTAGDVLTAAQVDGYLMRQSIMSFASVSARNTALSGNLEEGMHAYNRDNDELWYYDGSAWVPVYTQWTSFTPAWNNLTEGNATNSGRYRYKDGDLEVRARIIWGSTTSASGVITLDLPNSETAVSSPVGSIGNCQIEDASATAAFLVGHASILPSTSVIDLYFSGNNSDNRVDATGPITFTTGDEIRVDIRVDVA